MVTWDVNMGKNTQQKILNAHLFLDQNKRSELVSNFEKAVFTIIESAEQERFKTASEAKLWIGENGGKYKKCLTVKRIGKDNFRITRQPNNVTTLTNRMGYFILLTSGTETEAVAPIIILPNFWTGS